MNTPLSKLGSIQPGIMGLRSNVASSVRLKETNGGMYITGNTIFQPPKLPRKLEVSKKLPEPPPLTTCERVPLVSVLCSCGGVPHSGVVSKSQAVYSSDDDEDLDRESSDNDSEDEIFGLDLLLKSCTLYCQKDAAKRSIVALKNLALTYSGQDIVEEDHVEQILSLIDYKEDGMKEVGLLILASLCCRESNAFKFLYHDIMTKLLAILAEDDTCMEVQEATAHAIGKVGVHSALEDLWMEVMLLSGLDLLLDRMGAGNAPAVRLACGHALASLAVHRNLALLIIDHAMPTVLEFKDMNSDFKEVYTSILTRLVEHTDHTRASVMDVDALPTASHMLTQGPCCVQVQALVLFAALAGNEQGLRPILEGYYIPLIMSALVDSYCRKVRQHASAALAELVKTPRSSFQKQILVQIDKFYHDHEEMLDMRSGGNGNGSHFRVDTAGRINRGLLDLVKTVVNNLQKEARMDVNKKKTTQVHLTPGIDVDPVCLSTLSHLVAAVTAMGQLKINKVIKFKGFDLKDLAHHELKEIIRQSVGSVNPVIMKQLLDSGALCVFDLLHVYTTKLQQVLNRPPTLPRGAVVDSKKIKSILQCWNEVQMLTNDSVSKKNSNLFCDIGAVFDKNEIILINNMLEFAKTCAKCSCAVNDCNVEKEVQNKIKSFENTTEPRVEVQQSVPRMSSTASESVNTQKEKLTSQDKINHVVIQQEECNIRHSPLSQTDCLALCNATGTDIPEQREAKGKVVDKNNFDSNLPPELQWIMHIEKVQSDCLVESQTSPVLPSTSVAEDVPCTVPIEKLSAEPIKPVKCEESVSIDTHKLTVAVVLSGAGKAYQKELNKELSGQRRVVRMRLYEAGIIESVAPWIMCSDLHIRDSVLSTLESMVQMLEENVMPTAPKNNVTSRKGMRPLSAILPHERDHALDMALQQMSDRMAVLIEEALGPRPGKENDTSELKCGSNGPLDMSSTSDMNIPNPSITVEENSKEFPEKVDGIIVKEDLDRETYMKMVSSDPRLKESQSHGDYDKFARRKTAPPPHRTRPASAKLDLRLEGRGPKVAWSRPQSGRIIARSRSGSNSGPEGNGLQNKTAPIKSKSMQDLHRPVSGPEVKLKKRPASGRPSTVSDTSSLQSLPRSWSARSWNSGRARPGSAKSLSSLSSVSTVGKAKKVLNEIAKELSLLPWKPSLDLHQQVSLQCQLRVVEVAGVGLVQGLLAHDKAARKHVLLFLHLLVTLSHSTVHMKLSECGLMPCLVDFLRVNDDDQLLEVIGLILSRLLVSSDVRLCQLFTKHGGPQLLMAMTSYTCGLLRQEVSTTLKTVTRGINNEEVPVVSTAGARPPDIWDHIRSRWETEDRVMFMLRKWTT